MLAASTENSGVSEYAHTIDGHAETSTECFEVINPATGAVFTWAPNASPEQLDRTVVAAQRAYSSWRELSFEERWTFIEKFSQSIKAHVDKIAEILTREQGKPLGDAKWEVSYTARELRALSQFELPSQLIRADNEDRVELHYRPLGVVGVISPWNFPVLLAFTKIGHALLAGNTVVLKPSPYTPLSSLLIGELSREIFPPGVLNMLSGGNDLGRWITEHPEIARISFTGSIATGKRVFASAAETLKRLTLELGGNDPAILLEDVDVETTARRIFNAAMSNAGQICIAVKRVYAPESIYESFVNALTQLARAHHVGDGFDPDVQMGPVQNKMQFEKVRRLIEDARNYKGSRILEGGQALNPSGYFIAPTIVADLPEDARLVVEEQFGPVLPVLKYAHIDEAVRKANDTRFGLGASVWTKDVDRGAQIASRVEAGSVWINFHGNYEVEIPFGGFKESGFGRELGQLGLLSYMEPQIIHRSLE